jgi:hypothetical protein
MTMLSRSPMNPTAMSSPARETRRTEATTAELLLDHEDAGHGGGPVEPIEARRVQDPDAVLGADVHAAPAEDAQVRIEHHVLEALQAARRLDTCLILVVAELHLGHADAAVHQHRRHLHPGQRVVGDHGSRGGRPCRVIRRETSGPAYRSAPSSERWIAAAARRPSATASIRLHGPKAHIAPAEDPGGTRRQRLRIHPDRPPEATPRPRRRDRATTARASARWP